jgi:hypothetical protein
VLEKAGRRHLIEIAGNGETQAEGKEIKMVLFC